jgi:hypothetical protein
MIYHVQLPLIKVQFPNTHPVTTRPFSTLRVLRVLLVVTRPTESLTA